MNVVQIGANKGDDDLSILLNNKQPNVLILVEPLNLHNSKLEKFYHWVENLHIENVAIDLISNNDVTFYYHLDDSPGYEVSSLDPKHIYERHQHLKKERISSIQIKTLNINDLFEKYNLRKIDILFIDAEGLDDTIIKSINYDRFEITRIYFENLHIKDLRIYEFLIEKNYKITKTIGTNGWCSLAEKN
jgi:FkbM family methyltransferase